MRFQTVGNGPRAALGREKNENGDRQEDRCDGLRNPRGHGGFEESIEIAQRALSPGINDPTTALYCIDRLGQTFAHLAQRDIPSSFRSDESGKVRVLTESSTLTYLANSAFRAVGRYGSADRDVIEKLLTTLDALIQVTPTGSRGALDKLRVELASGNNGDNHHRPH